MGTKIFNHLAYSDESHHQDGRFSSIGLITFQYSDWEDLCQELKKLFVDSGITNEFKWKKVYDAKYKFAAEKLHAFIFKHLNKLRIDVLIWDKEDIRHKNIIARDDDTNLGIMYYQLLQNTLSWRWDNKAIWCWQPDEQSSMDWKTIGDCLINKKHKALADLFGISQNGFTRLNIIKLSPIESHKEVFVQVADYFAGLGVYSYGHFHKYQTWKLSQGGQASLFAKTEKLQKLSKSETVRFPLLQTFSDQCKNKSFAISLDSTKGLQTRKPSERINFWLYTPQHPKDKAPVKTNYIPLL
jgi:hypothetical protein